MSGRALSLAAVIALGLACRSGRPLSAGRDAGPSGADALLDEDTLDGSSGWGVVPVDGLAGKSLNGVWGSGPRDVWAVGEGGTSLHFDGDAWAVIPTGTSATLFAISGNEQNAPWAVGAGGTILSRSGDRWLSVPSGVTESLAGVAVGPAGQGVVAVGATGVFLASDAADANFKAVSTNAVDLSGVAPAWYGYVAVGRLGTILTYNVGALAAGVVDQTTSRDLRAAGGGVAVGAGGTVLLGGGPGLLSQAWLAMPTSTSQSLASVWTRDVSDRWAVGASGTILHYDGVAWSSVDSGTSQDLRGVWGVAASPDRCELWVVGAAGTILHLVRQARTTDVGVHPVGGRCPMMGAYPVDGGLCQCQTAFPTDCGGTCTDLGADDDNCGACGHLCGPTATCRQGVCGPEVTTFVPAAPGCGALDLAIAGGTLYTADRDHGTIQSRPLAGGAPTTIAAGEKQPDHITVGGTNLFWIAIAATKPTTNQSGSMLTSTTAVLRRAALPAGAPVDVATETNTNGGIRGLAASADGARIYYSADTNVRMIAAAGGVAVDVAHEERGGLPTALALEGDAIAYPVDINGDVDVATIVDGAVASCGNSDPVTGAPLFVSCTRVARGQGELFQRRILQSAGNITWVDGPTIKVSSFGSPSSFQSIASFDDSITAFVGEADNLYVATQGSTSQTSGLIFSTPAVVDGAYTPLARAQTAPASIAVAPTYVYWSTGDCRINRVAR